MKCFSELAELTREGMETGSNVITQIRVLASLADNADRPREAFDACLMIEKIMLKSVNEEFVHFTTFNQINKYF